MTQKNLPNPKDFNRLLEHTEKRHSTVNDILNERSDLVAFEQEYNLVSKEWS